MQTVKQVKNETVLYGNLPEIRKRRWHSFFRLRKNIHYSGLPVFRRVTCLIQHNSMEQITKVVVSALIWHDDKLLLFKRKRDFKELKTGWNSWDLPGGEVEFGEQLLPALQRELTEETASIRLNDSVKLLDILSYTLHDDQRITHRINLVYTMELANMPLITFGNEHDAFQCTGDPAEIQSLDMIQPIKDLVLAHIGRRS